MASKKMPPGIPKPGGALPAEVEPVDYSVSAFRCVDEGAPDGCAGAAPEEKGKGGIRDAAIDQRCLLQHTNKQNAGEGNDHAQGSRAHKFLLLLKSRAGISNGSYSRNRRHGRLCPHFLQVASASTFPGSGVGMTQWWAIPSKHGNDGFPVAWPPDVDFLPGLSE